MLKRFRSSHNNNININNNNNNSAEDTNASTNPAYDFAEKNVILGQRRPTANMDLFHHKDHHSKSKEKHKSGSRPVSATSSPQLAAVKPARLDIEIESPPLTFYGPPAQSTGALLSGQLKLNVTECKVRLNTFEMVLMAKVETKKPVSKDCPECTTKSSELFKWIFLTEPTHYQKGTYSFPFSYLLPGHLPATTHGTLGVIDYILSAKAVTSLADPMTLIRPIKISRALAPGAEKTSVRIFPPTNLTATVLLPPTIYPIGEFAAELRLTGVVNKGEHHQTRWRLRKLTWRLDEQMKIVSAACPKHAHKIGGEGKGVLHQDIRTIGTEDIKSGFKTDFESDGGGQIDMEFQAAINPGSSPLCDVESPTGLGVEHKLVLELIVAEESCPNHNTKHATPTGAARVLRMQFNPVVTERSGLGISWDEEQPPMYEDVPASPPVYAKMEDYAGEPLAYEDLDKLDR